MFCRYCGAHIPDDSRFCPKCGQTLEQPGPTPAQDPVPEPPKAGSAPGAREAAPKAEPAPERTLPKLPFPPAAVGAVAAALVVVLVLGFVLDGTGSRPAALASSTR